MSKEEIDKFTVKLDRVQRIVILLKNFNGFINESEWNKRFEMCLELFMDQIADANMRIFLGMPQPNDLSPKINSVPRQTKVKPVKGGAADEEMN
jgi:hypothetical protein